MKEGGAAIAAVCEAAAEELVERGGGAGDDDDTIEGAPPKSGGDLYSPDDPDEQRRAYVFQTLANSSYEAMPALEAMTVYDVWLKTGQVPEKEKPGSHLTTLRGGKK